MYERKKVLGVVEENEKKKAVGRERKKRKRDTQTPRERKRAEERAEIYTAIIMLPMPRARTVCLELLEEKSELLFPNTILKWLSTRSCPAALTERRGPS